MTLIALPEVGLSLPLPAGTDVVSEQPPLLLLAQIDGLRPWLTIAHTPTAAPSLGDWVAEELAGQQRSMRLALLVSHETCELWGNAGIRTLFHHAAEGCALTLAQWWTIVDGHGVLAAASCVTPHYHLVAPVLDEAIAGLLFDDDA